MQLMKPTYTTNGKTKLREAEWDDLGCVLPVLIRVPETR